MLIVLLATLIFFYPVWTKGFVPLPADFVVGVYFPWLDYKWGFPTGVPVKNPMTTDVVSFTYPMQMLAIDLLKSGKWPLWNPYILAGTPLLANFQSAPFSPTNFVYFIFDRLTAWSIQIMLQHFLAALFTYLLLRHWKVSKPGSLLGGIVFAFSGFNLLWSQWNGHALTAAFTPLLLFFEDRWLTKSKWYDGVCVSLALALQIFSGYPQVVLYTLGAMALLWLVRFVWSKEYLTKTLFLFVFGLLGLGLSAAQILPGKELVDLSQREIEPHPYEWAFLPWVKTITFFAPDFFGNHATKNYWGPQDYTSNTGFVGSVAFIFAMLSFSLARRREVLFGFVLLLSALLFAYPTPFSIFVWKSGFLGLQAASAHRALVLFDLAVAVLSGFGVDCFLHTARKKEILRALIIPAFVLASFAAWVFLADIPQSKVALKNLIFPTGIFILSSLTLLIASNTTRFFKYSGIIVAGVLMTFELFRFGWKFNPFSPAHIVFPTTPVLEFLQNQEKPFRTTGSHVIPINMRMPYKIESPEGYDAVYPLYISKFIAAVNSGVAGSGEFRRYAIVDSLTSPLLNLVNTKYYLVVKRDRDNSPAPEGKIPDSFSLPRFRVLFEDKSTAILENLASFPRAFMVYSWEEEKDDTLVLARLLAPNFPLDKKIVLAEEAPDLPDSGGKWSVSYRKYNENESILDVSTTKDGMLFVSDTYYSGWKAYVDGGEFKIYKADAAFRAVPIPAGKHEVRFIYEPKSFFGGLKVSVASVFLLFGFSFFIFRKR